MDLKDFSKSANLNRFTELLKQKKDLLIEGLWTSPKALLSALAFFALKRDVLLITSGIEESRLLDDMTTFSLCPLDFPAWESYSQESSPSEDIVGMRLDTLKKLKLSKTSQIVVAPLQAVLQKVLPPNELNQRLLVIKKNQSLDFFDFQKKLQTLFYTQVPLVTDKGQFAVRGGIIDLFPISSPNPYRIEFFDDEIASIRTFDAGSQRTLEKQEELQLLPAKEDSSNLVSILDYIKEDALIIFDDLYALEERLITLKKLEPKPSKELMSFKEFLEQAERLQKCFLTKEPIDTLSLVIKHKNDQLAFSCFNHDFIATRFFHPFVKLETLFLEDEIFKPEEMLEALSKFFDHRIHLKILSPTLNDERTFKHKLIEAKVPLEEDTEFEIGYLSSHFIIKDAPLAIIPTNELFQRNLVRRVKQRNIHHVESSSELLDLNSGDLVVHFNHGIGKYLGMETKPNHLGIQSEFLIIEYAEKSKLFVPIHQSYLISKYVGTSETLPTLHDLNSNRWKQIRTKTEGAILGYAKELLTLYAKRSIDKAYIFPEDSPQMHSFEAEFPYEATEDQLLAIQKIKEDMTSKKCMDRLVCGDVGFGKTEVAMRAAFKAVQDGGKQVAVLVPTTVLAMQHFENFKDRMRNFPVRVGVVSRFCTQKQIKETLRQVEEGSIDILIGTHRLVSKDVIFHNLGLIIIDEEQRFGVKVKEHLKTLSTMVDCLTLSATPIPRTLYMSLVGTRDMSVIATPPHDRLPIKTILTKNEDSVIQGALLRELARDGQAFIIHNRVETIFDVQDKVKKLIPEARVLSVHGQMSSDEIDEIFHAFKNGQADILISTTIIESGVDIPNANTILIDRADTFGLSELYQLRGRVGRWNRRAFCYFLTSPNRSLTEIARKRLSALVETSGFGGGMRIAMRDLEIRGAGDLLGIKQSGHVATVGFHLYCKLLKRTIEALQGKAPHMRIETKLDMPFDARIPIEYIKESQLRLEFYNRLGNAYTLSDIDELNAEIVDRFGKPPLAFEWLIVLTRLKLKASMKSYKEIKLQKVTLQLERMLDDKSMIKTYPFIAPSSPSLFEEKISALID